MKSPFPSEETLERLRPTSQLPMLVLPGPQAAKDACDGCPGQTASGMPALPSLNMIVPHQGLSLRKRNPGTWGGEAVISSFIFQFPFRSSSTLHAPGYHRGAEGGEKSVPPSTCSLGMPEGGDLPNPLSRRLLKLRFLAPQSLRWEEVWALMMVLMEPGDPRAQLTSFPLRGSFCGKRL